MFYAFLLIFLAMNVLFIVARYTSRIIERHIRSGYWYMTGRGTADDSSTTTPTTTKVLPRHHLTVRQAVCAYWQYLEDDAQPKGAYEQLLWHWYQANVSDHWRARDLATQDALPHWLELVAAAYNNFWLYNAVLLCLFFALSLGLMCYWPALQRQAVPAVAVTTPVLSEAEQLRAIVSEAVGREMADCGTVVQQPPPGEYCFFEQFYMTEFLGLYVDYYVDGVQSHWPPRLDGRHALLDRVAQPHYFVRAVDSGWEAVALESQRPRHNGSRLLSSAVLQQRLEMLRQEEETHGLSDAPCVCPPFLGLLDNLTVLYRGSNGWLVMPRPSIRRVNVGASEVRSTVHYHFNSVLYDLNLRLQQWLAPGDVVHYNTFIVEYDAPAQQEPSDALHELHGRLDAFYRRQSTQFPDGRHGIELLQRVPVERQTVQLKGNDAICYIYCDRMNAQLQQRIN
jgi:hypothetical protein